MGEAGHEILGEQRNVALARPQRRHEDRDHVQPEVQVLSKLPGLDRDRQILVRRGDHAHVYLDPLRAADRLDDLFLENAQYLRLRLQAHVTNLVQEDGSAVGHFELAAAVGDRAGEGAPDVAEQL